MTGEREELEDLLRIDDISVHLVGEKTPWTNLDLSANDSSVGLGGVGHDLKVELRERLNGLV